MRLLEATGTLPQEYRPHKLVGKYAGKWECHINGLNSDWLMVWVQNDKELSSLCFVPAHIPISFKDTDTTTVYRYLG